MAEAEGFVEIWLPTEHACKLIRNKCYAYRSRVRKQGMALTSIETSPYDGYTFTWKLDKPTNRFKFRIDSDEQVEFELIVQEDQAIPPGFDWITESDIPQLSLDAAEENFVKAKNEFYNADDDIPF